MRSMATLHGNTAGSENTASGYFAPVQNVTGDDNTAVGQAAPIFHYRQLKHHQRLCGRANKHHGNSKHLHWL
jgi:hypothetical protein